MSRAYEVITDRIIALIEAGTVPWHRPWGGPEHAPRNLASGKKYRGINVFMLSAAGYDAPYWLTFKQARDRDGHVRKGEQGFPCVFWNWREAVNDETGDVEKRPFLKYYTVFNVAQCDGVEYPAIQQPASSIEPNEACDRVVSAMPRAPPIRHGGDRACYHPVNDEVRMPPRGSFFKSEEYYGTLFHELVHSTGHQSRLARPGITEPIVFGTRTYSKEELVAEMGATFICGHVGIENAVIDNSASYVASWLRRLQNDSRLVVLAAAQSQKAVDYILNHKPEAEEPQGA